MTSTYYSSQDPSWLRQFNAEGLAKFLADSVWVSTVPPDQAHLSAPDTADFEGRRIHSYFPHRFPDEVSNPGPGDFFFWFEGNAHAGQATLDVALARHGFREISGRRRTGPISSPSPSPRPTESAMRTAP